MKSQQAVGHVLVTSRLSTPNLQREGIARIINVSGLEPDAGALLLWQTITGNISFSVSCTEAKDKKEKKKKKPMGGKKKQRKKIK